MYKLKEFVGSRVWRVQDLSGAGFMGCANAGKRSPRKECQIALLAVRHVLDADQNSPTRVGLQKVLPAVAERNFLKKLLVSQDKHRQARNFVRPQNLLLLIVDLLLHSRDFHHIHQFPFLIAGPL